VPFQYLTCLDDPPLFPSSTLRDTGANSTEAHPVMEQQVDNAGPSGRNGLSTAGSESRPDPSLSSNSSSSAKNGLFAAAAIEMAEALKVIFDLRQPYVPAKLLKRHKIKCERLDLKTGRAVGSGAQAYMQPIPPDTLSGWLDQSKRWRSGQMDLEPPGDDGQLSYNAFYEADNFWLLINDILQIDKKDLPNPGLEHGQGKYGLLEAHTTWRAADLGPRRYSASSKNNLASPLNVVKRCLVALLTRLSHRSLHGRMLNRTGQLGVNWQVKAQMHQCRVDPLQPDSVCYNPDPQTPHINVVLIDQVPIRDDQILVSEMITMLYLAIGSCKADMCPEHHIFPVR
jgi:hypothetical protein